MNKKPSHAHKAGITLSIILFFCLSAGINVLIYLNRFVGSEEAIAEAPGDNINPYTNMSFVQILSGVRGRIPILMYHNIITPRLERKFTDIPTRARRYYVTSAELREQLQKLHDEGFVNISLDEYLSLMTGDKTTIERLPPEKKLYILTFDDATFGQFDFEGVDRNGNPILDTNCAVGIMLDFARKYPDFKLNAAFSVDFANTPFLDARYVGKKLNMLLDYGFEIVNHTATHRYLANFIDTQPNVVAFEIGRAMELFESYLGYRAATIDKICYPGGIDSIKLQDFVHEVKYNGREYKFVLALDAEGYQAANPNSPDFNPYDIARIELNSHTFESDVLYARGVFQTPGVERSTGVAVAAGEYDIYSLLSNGILEQIP